MKFPTDFVCHERLDFVLKEGLRSKLIKAISMFGTTEEVCRWQSYLEGESLFLFLLELVSLRVRASWAKAYSAEKFLRRQTRLLIFIIR